MPSTARLSRKRRWIAISISALLLFLFLAWEVFAHKVLEVVEQQTLTTGPNGPQTPATFGIPYKHVFIWSDRREPQASARTWRLDANLVTAPSTCGPDAPAVLLFHGAGETISDWANAQQFLYTRCVSSLVFDPTGSGNSPRPATIDDINADAQHAYTYFAQRFAGRRLYVLGHSLGNAFMLPGAAQFDPAPLGLIEANGFASLHSIAGEGKGLTYRALMDTTPDWLDNVKAVRKIHTPILVIVSDADQHVPMRNGLSIFAAAPEPKQLVTLHGFGHSDIYKNPTDAWWSAALAFMKAPVPVVKP